MSIYGLAIDEPRDGQRLGRDLCPLRPGTRTRLHVPGRRRATRTWQRWPSVRLGHRRRPGATVPPICSRFAPVPPRTVTTTSLTVRRRGSRTRGRPTSSPYCATREAIDAVVGPWLPARKAE